MISNEHFSLQNFKKNNFLVKGNNLNKVEFLKKLQSERKSSKTPFSNSLLKKNCTEQKISEEIVQKRLLSQYSPRKQPKLFESKTLKSMKDNPYNCIAQEQKKLQLIMRDSFKKSFNIAKKPIFDHQTLLTERQSRINLLRIKENLSIGHVRSKSDFQHYSKEDQNKRHIQKQPNKSIRRMIHSAIGDNPRTKSIKNLSSINYFFKTNVPCESILID